VFCAISSDAIIDRSKAPKDIADKLVKSEFVTDALDKKMNFKKFYNLAAKIADTRPSFNQQELLHICQFLLGNIQPQHKNNAVNEALAAWATPIAMQPKPVDAAKPLQQPAEINKPYIPVVKALAKAAVEQPISAMCKHCGDCSALSPQPGRYGYYVQCGKCGGNTPLKKPCPACKSQNTKVSKARSVYRLNCVDCAATAKLILSNH
jgi:hypothetical protein